MEIHDYHTFHQDEIVELYESAGWTNYTNRKDTLRLAYEGSLCVLGAYEGEKLIGIIRAVGDGVTILFIQDVIVLPQYQRQGIGSALLTAILEKYRSVYQVELLTDNTDQTIAFYRSMGFTPANEMGCLSFVRM